MKTIDLSLATVRDLNQALHDQAIKVEEREWVVSHPNGEVVLAVAVGHHPLAVFEAVHLVMQGLVEVAHRGAGEIDGFHVRAP